MIALRKKSVYLSAVLVLLCQSCLSGIQPEAPIKKNAFSSTFLSATEVPNTPESFAMTFNAQGQGIAVVGNPLTGLRFHPVEQFKVSSQGTRLTEEIKAGFYSAENFMLDAQGTGTFFIIQAELDTFSISPGNEPPRNNRLRIYTVPIQNYAVAGPLQTLSFTHRYATLHAQSVVVDPEGKGSLTLKLSEADPDQKMGSRALHFVTLPIEKHKIQQQEVNRLAIPADGNLCLNGDLNGAYLFQKGQQWFLQAVEKGQLKDEAQALPFTPSGVPALQLSAEGKGYASVQQAHAVEVQGLNQFVKPVNEMVTLPRWDQNSLMQIAYDGEQGFSIELSAYTLSSLQLRVRLNYFSQQGTQTQVFEREVLPFDKGTPPHINTIATHGSQALFLWSFFDKQKQAWQLFWEPIAPYNKLNFP